MSREDQRTLVVLRHAKSDWSVPAADHDRPLAARGRRQAAEAGRWLAAHLPPIDTAVVSTAARAARTWEIVAAELAEEGVVAPVAQADGRIYTFDPGPLVVRVRALPAATTTVALVGHNPAVEGLVERLTGQPLVMKTSAIAVCRWSGRWADAGSVPTQVVAHGRPPGSG